MHYSDADPQDFKYEEINKDLVYHSQLMIGNHRILLWDDIEEELPKKGSVYLVISFDTEEKLKSAYNILAEGAMSTDSQYGHLIDKYGIHWEFIVYNWD